MINVSIIEDDPATRIGLAQVVGDVSGMSVAVSVGTIEGFESAIREPHVVMLDLSLRGSSLDGPAAVRHLREMGHVVLVLSMFEEELPVLDAISAGANGYLTKEAEPAEIVRALSTVAAGKTYFSASVAGYLLKDRVKLTGRETEILRLVASGETTADIARLLFIGETTVNTHLDNIRNKTGCRRRPDLTRFAFEKGLLHFRRKQK